MEPGRLHRAPHREVSRRRSGHQRQHALARLLDRSLPRHPVELRGRPSTDFFKQCARGRNPGAEAIPEETGERGLSGTPEGSDDLLEGCGQPAADASWFTYKEHSGWTFITSRSDEVDIKKLCREEKERFDASDKIEWEAILKTKAVRVAYGKEAQRIKEMYPDRILASRMVRRKKPLPGMHQWKAKSRWCIAGHSDPDTEHLVTFSPTPSTEGMMSFLHTGLGLGHSFSFCDVKNAFYQSDPLKRPRGPLFAQPTEGLGLPSDALIIIDVPVYGLDDAPAAWRNTVVSYLAEQNFVRNLVEPCWWMRFNEAGENEAQILIEVDDFIVSAKPEVQKSIKEVLHARFDFGKWEEATAEYAGRRICCQDDRITVDQEKYIIEQITPIPLAKHRKAQKDDKLTADEFQVAKETRPEMSGWPASWPASSKPPPSTTSSRLTRTSTP